MVLAAFCMWRCYCRPCRVAPTAALVTEVRQTGAVMVGGGWLQGVCEEEMVVVVVDDSDGGCLLVEWTFT